MADLDDVAIEAEQAEPGEGGRRRPWRGLRWPSWRRVQLVGLGLVACGLFSAGATAGWWAHELLAEVPTTEVTVAVDRPVLLPQPPPPDSMPSLVGLKTAQARHALLDAGVSPSDVVVRDVPAAGPEGIVVRQMPAPGERVGASATIEVSAPAAVPAVVGLREGGVRSQLSELGARVTVVREFAADAAEGTVLAVRPPAGERLPLEVELVVAAAPSSVFLTALEAIDSDCHETSVAVDGTERDESLVCSTTGGGDAAVAEYSLNRKVGRLEAVLGQADDGPVDRVLTVRFFGDQRLLAEHRVPFGRAVPVSVPLSGVLRLRIEATENGRSTECCQSAGRAVIGTARLVGAPEAIDELVEGHRP